jgi:hypothetical protein
MALVPLDQHDTDIDNSQLIGREVGGDNQIQTQTTRSQRGDDIDAETQSLAEIMDRRVQRRRSQVAARRIWRQPYLS